MSAVLDPASLPEGLSIPAADWPQTPLSVRLVVLTLLKRLETHETQWHQLNKGAIQQMVERVSEAIRPHDTAMGVLLSGKPASASRPVTKAQGVQP